MAYKLLLADDSVTIQKVVELTFSDEDFEIIAVGDGASALEKIRSIRPDIILSDVIMPGLNGYDLCLKVKQDKDLARIPFLFLKGTFESFDEERAKASGSDGFIIKPFESQELIGKVRELVEKAKAALAAAAPEPVAPALPAAPVEEALLAFEEEPILREMAAAPIAPVEGLESFQSDFAAFGETREPLMAEPASEEDLWSEVKISDHPIPPVAVPGFVRQAAATRRDIPREETPEMVEISPVDLGPIMPVAHVAPPIIMPKETSRPEPVIKLAEPVKPAPAITPAATATQASAAISNEAVSGILSAKVEEILREIAPGIIRDVTRQVISEVIWEVVPETAEKLIQKEIDRLTGKGTR